MKNVVLIGASGFVGTAILNELLNRGNKVTAIVRNPEKITISNCNLSVVKANVSDVETIATTCKGKDVVISAYNPGRIYISEKSEQRRNTEKLPINPQSCKAGKH